MLPFANFMWTRDSQINWLSVSCLFCGKTEFVLTGKRPLSSMSPSIILDSDRNVHLVFGAAGGILIPSAIALVATRNLWLGQSVKEAVDSCRIHHSLIPMTLQYEKGYPKVGYYLIVIVLLQYLIYMLTH